MLVFPTFVQQAVQIKEKQIEAQNSDHAKIKRSINIFEDPSEKAKPPVIENSDMTCK
jgi:hypothetical protein